MSVAVAVAGPAPPGHPGESYLWNLLTPEQKEALRKKRNLALPKLYKLSLVQMVMGVISVGIGIATIVISWPNRGFPYTYGGPIIIGALVGIGGVCGYFAVKEGEKQAMELQVTQKVRCLAIAHYTLCVTSISFSILTAAFSGWGLGGCLGPKEEDKNPCYPNYDGNVTMMIIGIILGVIMAVIVIFGTCIFCVYGRAFGFTSKHDRRLAIQAQYYEQRLQQMQMQVQQQQQGFAQPYGQNQQGLAVPGGQFQHNNFQQQYGAKF